MCGYGGKKRGLMIWTVRTYCLGILVAPYFTQFGLKIVQGHLVCLDQKGLGARN